MDIFFVLRINLSAILHLIGIVTPKKCQMLAVYAKLEDCKVGINLVLEHSLASNQKLVLISFSLFLHPYTYYLKYKACLKQSDLWSLLEELLFLAMILTRETYRLKWNMKSPLVFKLLEYESCLAYCFSSECAGLRGNRIWYLKSS